MDTFRDTCAGQIVRLLSGKKTLLYPDERDPHLFRHGITNDLSLTRSRTNAEWTNTRNVNNTMMSGDERVSKVESLSATTPALQHQMTTDRKLQPPEDNRTSETRQLGLEPTITQSSEEKMQRQITGSDTNFVGFLDDDPEDPQNWSLSKKCWVTAQICFLTFCIYIGSAIYTAGEEGITQHFHVSTVVATLGLTVFVLGYGLGPMFLAGFAEAPPIGRSPVYLLSVLSFVLLNLGVYYASNFGMLLAFRFLTGFVGSPVLATGGASLADMWSPTKRMYAIGIWGLFAVGGPVGGPLAGNFAAQFKGWRWPILELIWLNTFCTILLAFCLPETSAATILYHRAKRLRKSLNDPTLMTEAELEVQSISKGQLLRDVFLMPFRLGFGEPILLATNLYLGLVYAILYCWFEAFPITFLGIYGWSLGVSGLAYLGILIGAIVGLVGYFVYLRLHTEKAMVENRMTPEMRLPAACFGSICLPVCMFWFGWTARASVHWVVPIIGSGLFSVGAMSLFNAILNYQADAYPKYVGAVYSGNDLFRSGMGAGFPVFAGAMFNTLGLDWGCSLLGFLSIAFIPIPFGLWYYGKRIRLASKLARHDI